MTPKGVQRALKAGPSAREIHGARKTYVTVYPANGGSYGGVIEAHTQAEARFVAWQRRIGERVMGTVSGNSLLGVVETLLKKRRRFEFYAFCSR